MKTKNPILLQWTYHPFRETPLRGSLVFLFLVFLFLCLDIQGQNPLAILGWAIFLFFSLSPYYLPTHYILREREMVVRNLFTQRFPWDKWKRWEEIEKGFLLSPFPKPSYLDTYKSIVMCLPASQKEEFRNQIRSLLERKLLERSAP